MKDQQLLTFAREFREAEGLGTQYPTVRECAKELGVTQKVALALASDLKDQSYPVDILVGYRTTHGHAVYGAIGDYLIEVYDDVNEDERATEDFGHGHWYLESDSKKIEVNAHCVCCAYADAIAQHGGDCDLRGLSVYGICYSFLSVMVRQSRRGEPLEGDE